MKKNALIIVLAFLLMLAILGVLMRQAPLSGWLPVPYDHLRHAHSHLAFLGWAWGALALGLVEVLTGGRWTRALAVVYALTLATALSMTVSFWQTGYGRASIILLSVHATLAVLFFLLLGSQIRRWEGVSGIPERRAWRWGSVLFVASILGPLLIPVIRSLPIDQLFFYGAAIHFYLHFHYDGWFVLIWLSLWFGLRAQYGLAIPKRRVGWMAVLLTLGAVLTYGLPYMRLYPPLRTMALIGGGARVAAAVLLVLDWRRSGARQVRQLLPAGAGWALAAGFFLFLVKESVQWMSSWPGMERWLNPTVPALRVAYLHLMFLGVLTPFLLIFFYAQSWLKSSLFTRFGWRVYWVGFGITIWYLLAEGWGLQAFWRPAPVGMLLVGSILLLVGLATQLLGWRFQQRRSKRIQTPEPDFPDV